MIKFTCIVKQSHCATLINQYVPIGNKMYRFKSYELIDEHVNFFFFFLLPT